MMITYIGNGAYCYANTTAMLLAASGETISPSQIEVLSGVGLGGLWEPNANLLLFGFESPDTGISAALKLLGFTCTERVCPDDAPLPLDDLRALLETGPVVIGPVDMGALTYMPDHERLIGVDHYALAYGMGDGYVELHDPAEFPCVRLPFDALDRAWRAERIGYRRGAFRCWTAAQRQHTPASDALFAAAMQRFREVYAEMARVGRAGHHVGADAIHQVAELIGAGDSPAGLLELFSHFSFPVGAKRALDYAAFFAQRAPMLAETKWQQAQAFGAAQSAILAGAYITLAAQLHAIAEHEAAITASFA